jgi:UMP-CMP kinase family protein
MTDIDNKQKQFDQYIRDHKIDELFNELTEKLIKEKPQNPIDFIVNQLESKKTNKASRKVVFVLGGPGSGKGTQCSKLVEQFGFVHYSAGDLLREEAKLDTDIGRMIAQMIQDGAIVPGYITIELLRKAIFNHPNSENTQFLIDGFPREMKQALDFERQVTPAQFVLFFDCPEQVLEERLLKRGETSGRSDDNMISIRKRFQTYQRQTIPVIEYFGAQDKVRKIDSAMAVHEVFNATRSVFGV